MNPGRSLALAVVCVAGCALLRSETYATVSGVILDASASSVPGALVTIVNEDSGFRWGALSEPDGGYSVSSLQPGLYKITVRKPGFRTVIRFGVKLSPAQATRVDFRLAIGSVLESITVEGSAPLLNAEDASVGTLLGREEEEHLPLNGRGVLGLMELTPGVVVTPATHGEAGQFTVNGQRPNTNYFTVDGASANSGVSGGGLPAQATGGTLPGMTAFGSMDSLVSLDALQETRVQTSSTVPEFGRMPGAQVSLTSRSGSNQFHGALMYGFRNAFLDANNWFANQQGNPRAPLHLHDFGGALGGPLWRNHTFFFISYQGLRLTQPFVWLEPVPSLDARSSAPRWVQPALNLFPAPNGVALANGLAQWSGQVSRPSNLDVGALRLDQTIGSRQTAFARFSQAPSSTEFSDNSVNWLNLHSTTFTGGLNMRTRPNLIFDFRMNASTAAAQSVWGQTAAQPDCALGSILSTLFPLQKTCDFLLRVSIAGVGDVISGPEGRRAQSQLQFSETTTWNHGTHTVHFGADYRRLEPSRQDSAPSFSILASSLDDFKNTSNLWTANSAAQNLSGVVEEGSVFAEDTWQIKPRLTATYGLRWEISPAPLPGSPANYLDPTTGQSIQLQRPIWRSSYANFAPRVGLAYRLTKSGRTILRAGGGLYFDSSLSLATDLVNDGPLNVSQYGSARHAPFSALIEFGFLPNLRLPKVAQWNVSIEHALSEHDSVSASYVGSLGRDLIRREIGGAGSTDLVWFALATNDGSSDYHSLQLQYRRRLSLGLQVLASYAWSHSIDNSSTDGGLYWAGPSVTPAQDRASSDFDVRHVLTAGFSYEAGAGHRQVFFRGWTLDGMFHARTGFPINVLDAEQYVGIGFENIFRPNLIGGQPLWISNAAAPGGRVINPAAFQVTAPGVQGNLGRNALPGFGMSQLDLALRREFFSGERRSIEFRVEAFNALNHANFADPIRFLSSPLFGESNSMLNMMLGTGSPGSGLAPVFQPGGARTIQVSLRLRF